MAELWLEVLMDANNFFSFFVTSRVSCWRQLFLPHYHTNTDAANPLGELLPFLCSYKAQRDGDEYSSSGLSWLQGVPLTAPGANLLIWGRLMNTNVSSALPIAAVLFVELWCSAPSCHTVQKVLSLCWPVTAFTVNGGSVWLYLLLPHRRLMLTTNTQLDSLVHSIYSDLFCCFFLFSLFSLTEVMLSLQKCSLSGTR